MFQKAKPILCSHVIAEAQWKKGNAVVSFRRTPQCCLQHLREVVTVYEGLGYYRPVSKAQRSQGETVGQRIDEVKAFNR